MTTSGVSHVQAFISLLYQMSKQRHTAKTRNHQTNNILINNFRREREPTGHNKALSTRASLATYFKDQTRQTLHYNYGLSE